MSKTDNYDLSQVPRDLLEMYVRSSISVLNINAYRQTDLASLVLQAARKPLRTRAEVRADTDEVVCEYAHYCSNLEDSGESLFLRRAYHRPDGAIETIKSPVYEVTVTEEHITRGDRGECVSCPIALAIREVCPDQLISVGPMIAHVGHWAYEVPEYVKAFINSYDSVGLSPVLKPFKFRLEGGRPST